MTEVTETAEDYFRWIRILREANETGQLAGIMFVTLHVAENHVAAQRSGRVSRRRRVDDVDQLARAIERNRNFTTTFRDPSMPLAVEPSVKASNGDAISKLESLIRQGLVEGLCAVFYGADGGTYALSKSTAPLASMRVALEIFSDVAWGEDGIYGANCSLDNGVLFLPTAEGDERAKALGVDLLGADCKYCGKPTRLIKLWESGCESAPGSRRWKYRQ